jgi:hypothetical protein
MSSRQALVSFDHEFAPANGNGEDPAAAEGAALESVVSAAVLVTTAFRLRDEDGLIGTLRLLTAAVDALEAERTAAAA